MKKHFLTLGIVALALSAGLSSACKITTGNNNNNGNGNGNGNNNASASSSPPAPKTSGAASPTEAFKTFYNGLKSKDIAAVKSVLPQKVMDAIAEDAKSKNKPLDEFYRDEVIPQMSRNLPESLPETRNEQFDGDRASIEYQKDGEWKTGHFTKEGGSWKIDT